jgi:transcriptional regulator with XRE-family HTH domain
VNKTRDKDLLMRFGNHLAATRKSKKLSLEKLAIEADIEISQVHRIEKGKINPTLSTLHILAKALHVDLKDLVSF